MGREFEEKRREWGEFKFGVIAPVVCGKYSKSHEALIRQAILAKKHLTPDGRYWQISERTLRNWTAQYKKDGLRGLYTKKRRTRGRFKAIEAEFLAAAEKLRREVRSRSVKQIMHQLSIDGFDVSKVSRTTLNLHLNRLGAKKEKPYAEKGAFQRWQKEHINELWQTDTSDGIWLPDPNGLKKVRQTSLVTFIDDASRLLLHGEFYWNEKLASLLDCFKKAVSKRGCCGEIYSDKGSIFKSKQWKSVCAELGIGQLFAEEAPGKGKQERHYLTIQRSFYKEAQLSGIQTLEELNEFFHAWIDERYHREEHGTLKQAPLERWQKEEHIIERVSPEKLKEALKLRADRKVDYKTCLVQLNGMVYQASKELGGEKVQVRWEFDSNEEIEIWIDDELKERAKRFIAGANIDYSRRPEREVKPERGYVLESSKRYRLGLVAKQRGELYVAGTQKNDLLSEPEFLQLIEKQLARVLDDMEKEQCSLFCRNNYPLRRDLVETVLGQSIAEKGVQMHVKIYLRRIEDTQRKQR